MTETPLEPPIQPRGTAAAVAAFIGGVEFAAIRLSVPAYTGSNDQAADACWGREVRRRRSRAATRAPERSRVTPPGVQPTRQRSTVGRREASGPRSPHGRRCCPGAISWPTTVSPVGGWPDRYRVDRRRGRMLFSCLWSGWPARRRCLAGRRFSAATRAPVARSVGGLTGEVRHPRRHVHLDAVARALLGRVAQLANAGVVNALVDVRRTTSRPRRPCPPRAPRSGPG